MDAFRAALAWAARGFRVFPLHPNTKDAPVYGKGWPDYASTDPAQIQQWWIDPFTNSVRDYNIASLTNDLCLVDLDVRDVVNGADTFAKAGGGPDTFTVQSPSGGYHLYYRPPRPIAGNQGDAGFGPGVDVRGWHGFALAPGSFVDGKPYVLVRDVPIAPMPDHFWPYLREPGEKREMAERPAAVELDTPAAITAVTEYLTRAKPAIEGQHGDFRTLTVAMECRDLGVSAAVCLDLMLDHFNERCEPPWDPDELQAKVENAYNYAQNQAGGKAAAALFAGVAPMETVPLTHEPVLGETSTPYRPFTFGNLIPHGKLVARQWIVDRFLERGEVTALIAPGGIGKSQLVLSIAILLAAGAPTIFGFRNCFAGTPKKSIIYNAEDSMQEMSKRVHAFCFAHQIDPYAIAPYMSLTSGKDFGLTIASGGAVAHRSDTDDEHIGYLISASLDPEVVMTSLDPLSKIHTANPNDNRDMNIVMGILSFIAARGDVGLVLPAHTSKPDGSAKGYAGNVNSMLGATAVADSVRIAYTLMGPSDDDAARYGISDAERHKLLRLDDAKMNRTLRSGAPHWLQKESVTTWTHDIVGVFKSVDMQARVLEAREIMASTIYAELQGRGVAHCSITEAVGILQSVDPIYSHMPVAAVRNRVERQLASVVELTAGGTLAVQITGTTRTVVIT